MKTTHLFRMIALVAVISLASCSKDSNSTDTGISSSDVQASRKMDQASDDVSSIVEDQFTQQFPSEAGKSANTVASLIPACATVTTTVTSTSWTRTVLFNNCVFNGNTLNGTIIVSGSLPFTPASYVINYQFVNFTHNGNLVAGNRTVTRTMASSTLLTAIHPIHTMDIDMTVTLAASGVVYHRVGTRTRECVEGFGFPINWDNRVYKVWGSMTTTRPDGGTQTNVILVATPLTFRNSCQYKLVSGIITITRPNHTAVLDYGNGDCDANYTISIDGGTPVAHTFGS